MSVVGKSVDGGAKECEREEVSSCRFRFFFLGGIGADEARCSEKVGGRGTGTREAGGTGSADRSVHLGMMKGHSSPKKKA